MSDASISGSNIEIVEQAVIKAATDLYMACSQAAIDRVKAKLAAKAAEQQLEAEQLQREAHLLLMNEE